MSDIKLFRTSNSQVYELSGGAADIEKSLQAQIELNLEEYLGIRFLETEYSTGSNHGGRIDTLGIDENSSPVIIEYKRHRDENVINQGLFYLDWLLDHKAEFELLVLKKYGKEHSDSIEWNNPRLLCIAGAFTKFDEHAVKQMNRNIELIRYIKFDEDLLLLELVNVVEAKATGQTAGGAGTTSRSRQKSVSEYLESAGEGLKLLYESVQDYMISLGDDVQEKTLKHYIAFKRIKNFACVEIHPQHEKIYVYVKVNPEEIEMVNGFIRDVREIGHFGTGDLEITIRSEEDLRKAEDLILMSYNRS